MKIIFLLLCTVTLLATSGCIFRDGGDHGGDRGHSDHGDRGDHGSDHHDDDHH